MELGLSCAVACEQQRPDCLRGLFHPVKGYDKRTEKRLCPPSVFKTCVAAVKESFQ